MQPFTICSILEGISLGPSIIEILGSVRTRNGKQQWPDKDLAKLQLSAGVNLSEPG